MTGDGIQLSWLPHKAADTSAGWALVGRGMTGGVGPTVHVGVGLLTVIVSSCMLTI